jgi:hypothetical protein
MRHRNKLLIAISAFTVLAGFGPAQATIVFQDDFETAPEVSSAAPRTSGDVDADPVAQVGTWNVNDRLNVNSDQVTNYPTPGLQGGNNYGRMVDPSSSEWRAIYTSPQTEKVTLDTWINVHEVSMRLFLRDAGGANIGGWLTWGEGGAGMMGYRYAGSWNNTAVPYTPDTWQHLTVVAHFASQTMDLTLDGNTQTGIPFYGTIADFGEAFFAAGGSTQAVYLDNVVAYTGEIPEPASAALMGMASLLVLRRRR